MNSIQKRRTIYFVWNYLNWGGAQIHFLAIIKAARRDWDILVLLPKGSSNELLGFLAELETRYEFLEHSLENSPTKSFAQKLSRQFVRLRSEAEIFRRLGKFDLKNSIVHIEIAPWQSWQLLSLLSFRGANVFITLHNFLSGGNRLRQAIWKTRTSLISRLRGIHIFASNKDAKERFRGWFSKNFHDSIEVTYTSIDPVQIAEASEADRDSIRKKFGIEQDDFVVLCVGQFVDRKGRWVFLDAAAELRAKGEKITFMWLMPQLPSDSEMVKISKLGLGESFRPVLSTTVGSNRLNVLSFFRAADVFVLASYVEGLPIALLEAMALGIPSISTNVFAIPEAVVNEETGLLIEPGDSAAVADSVLRLKNDTAFSRGIATRGAASITKNFDERAVSAKVISAYEEALRNV